MKRKKLQIAAAGLVLILGIFMSGLLGEPCELERLMNARRAEARFRRWEPVAAYRLFCRLTKTNPSLRNQRLAEELERKLLQSGDLVRVSFHLFGNRKFEPLSQKFSTHYQFNDLLHIYYCYVGDDNSDKTKPAYALVRRPNGPYEDWTVICPAQDIAFWQEQFCVMRTYIRWKELRRINGAEDGAGYSQYTQCWLPGHSTGTVFECQQWLNDSIGAGLQVGLMSSNSPAGDLIFVPFSKR